jgi:hypothetical protein
LIQIGAARLAASLWVNHSGPVLTIPRSIRHSRVGRLAIGRAHRQSRLCSCLSRYHQNVFHNCHCFRAWSSRDRGGNAPLSRRRRRSAQRRADRQTVVTAKSGGGDRQRPPVTKPLTGQKARSLPRDAGRQGRPCITLFTAFSKHDSRAALLAAAESIEQAPR